MRNNSWKLFKKKEKKEDSVEKEQKKDIVFETFGQWIQRSN